MRMTWAEFLAYNAKMAGGAAPAPTGEGVDDESDLHQQILDECKKRQWIALHGSMAHRAMRTPGEFDFTILADRGRVFFVEAKSKTGKMTTEQLGLKQWAERLGHTVHVLTSLGAFLSAVDTPP